MPELKVCGVRDAAFAREATTRGIAYLGLIFAASSPRRVDVAEARAIASAVAGRARLVGVFTDHPVGEIVRIAALVGMDVIQLHGSYSAEDVAALKAEGYGVWTLHGGDPRAEDLADAVLLDGRRGTESRRADWSLVAPLKRAGRHVVLAGGISADNIAAAAATGADILDINSSIETSPGVKSLARLDALLEKASGRVPSATAFR